MHNTKTKLKNHGMALFEQMKAKYKLEDRDAKCEHVTTLPYLRVE